MGFWVGWIIAPMRSFREVEDPILYVENNLRISYQNGCADYLLLCARERGERRVSF